MRNLCVTLLVIVMAVGAVSDSGAAAGVGVFGTIRGRKFKARGTGKIVDRCVVANYSPAARIFLISALECRGRRRRTRKNAANVVLGCGEFDPSAIPVELRDCISSLYIELKTGRFGAVLSTATWGTSIGVVDDVATTSVRVRVDSFDGTFLEGAFYGVFDAPVGAVPSPTAPIGGEGRFRVRVTLQ